MRFGSSGTIVWVLFAVLSWPSWAAAQSTNMSVDEAHRLAVNGDIVLIDIRAPKEWRQSGVPASGRTITMYQWPQGFVSALKAAAGGDGAKPIALICATGVRSLYVQKALRQAGFKSVINVVGGMFGTKRHRGWLKAGLPTRTWSKPKTQ